MRGALPNMAVRRARHPVGSGLLASLQPQPAGKPASDDVLVDDGGHMGEQRDGRSPPPTHSTQQRRELKFSVPPRLETWRLVSEKELRSRRRKSNIQFEALG